jgi:hypothetical protein
MAQPPGRGETRGPFFDILILQSRDEHMTRIPQSSWDCGIGSAANCGRGLLRNFCRETRFGHINYFRYFSRNASILWKSSRLFSGVAKSCPSSAISRYSTDLPFFLSASTI